MKRVLLLALIAGAAGVAWYQAGSASRPVARLFPGGALLYLEARDFSRLLADWNSSTVKQDWLGSDNYTVFEQSNLFLKLNGVYKAYGAAAGFTPDMASLRALAGDESALALYDLQHVQFAYVTHLPESKIAQTRLWLGRQSFQSRQAAGFTFYVNTSADSTVAFASANGYLLICTDEERMAGMLGLIANQDTPNIASEGWYKQSTEAAGAPGELRLAMNLENLVESTYFRSYWVQRNASDVRRFVSGVADINRTSSEIREQRLFLKRPGLPEELPPADAIAAAGSLEQIVPDNAGLDRVWAGPRKSDAEALVDRLFNPRPFNDVMPLYSPAEDRTEAAGSEADLETHIDQPPLPKTSAAGQDLAAKILAPADILAMIQLQSSQPRPNTSFIALPCAIGLQSRTSWDADIIKNAIGGSWTSQTRGPYTVLQPAGLGEIAFAVAGPVLVIANSQELLQSIVDRPAAAPSAATATYVARFHHDRERANYARLMTALDFSQSRPGQQPAFFSGNMASLSSALRRVNGIALTERNIADRVEQRVVYSLAPPQ
jgi:hypothetical protein